MKQTLIQRTTFWASLTAMILAALWTATDGRAQPTEEIYVTPGEGRSLIPVAVPPFDTISGAPLSEPLISSVVMRDLILSGLFQPPRNEAFARETHLIDQAKNMIHFAEWYRMGVFYLVKGAYEIQNGMIRVEVIPHDTAVQRPVFRRSYGPVPLDELRKLSHQISDDLIQRITGQEGVSGTRIAFVRQLDPMGITKQVTIMDADGHHFEPISGNGILTATPAWGAQSTELYYMTYEGFNPDLQGVVLKNRQTWWISRFGGLNASPAWSESTQRITLTLSKDQNSEIYTMTRGGKDVRRLTVNRAIDCSPEWSPDGSRIAFTSDRAGSPQIYIMDADGKNDRRLTYAGSYNDGAAWAPRGENRIAYASRMDGYFQICTINADGSNLRQLTSGPYNHEDPAWAPNGLALAFTSNRTGEKQIYTMFMDGSNAQRLTSGLPCYSPAWSPKTNVK